MNIDFFPEATELTYLCEEEAQMNWDVTNQTDPFDEVGVSPDSSTNQSLDNDLARLATNGHDSLRRADQSFARLISNSMIQSLITSDDHFGHSQSDTVGNARPIPKPRRLSRDNDNSVITKSKLLRKTYITPF